MTGTPAALVDPAALAELAEDVGPAAAAGMVGTFISMLDARLERLHAAGSGELHVAVLSLACSADMLGGRRLARAARELEGLPARDRETALEAVERLARCTASALLRMLPGRAA